jgi:hypothetical protein
MLHFPQPGANKHYLYTGAYPDGFLDECGINLGGIVFYVGYSRTRGYKDHQRMQEHEAYARNGYAGQNYVIIRKIQATGLQVQWNIVYETEERSKALAMEKHLIRQVYAGPHLTNISYNPVNDTYQSKQRKVVAELVRNFFRDRQYDAAEHLILEYLQHD